MIRVAKSTVVPEKLRTEGLAETEALCAAYTAGERSLNFKARLYADRKVKEQLLAEQNNKCCFCESITIESSDVEHFRPKGGVTGEPDHPGYYWLAYQWTNLLICCTTCNSRFKKNQFPLQTGGIRAFAQEDPLSAEQPTLLNPTTENPEEHLRFNRWNIEPLTPRGQETIRITGLNRSELLQSRRKRWETIKVLQEILQNTVLPELQRQKAKEILDDWRSPSGDYSLMARQA